MFRDHDTLHLKQTAIHSQFNTIEMSLNSQIKLYIRSVSLHSMIGFSVMVIYRLMFI